ncbi:hypothetical protein FACS1894172_09330 [Spirochaetia bacterium]|nr:hypothetical protein FACS1894164_11590 [Spirochaetia bacterium]GHU32536.1 hypothetical protein FACS1894172_09330 [Spirochaetia bacterium]
MALDKKSLHERIISALRSRTMLGQSKYRRNFRYYWGSLHGEPLSLSDSVPLGYDLALGYPDEDYGWSGYDEAEFPLSAYNGIKSNIDTLVSKMANQKVRPLLTPIHGDWAAKRVVKQVQLFFDDLYSTYNINKIITKAFKLSCIYDAAGVFLNPFTTMAESLSPWQFAILPSEFEYGKLTKLLVVKDNFPASLLKDYDTRYDSHFYVKLELYVDTVDHIKELFINGQSVKRDTYRGEQIPLSIVNFNEPTNGDRSTSMVDDLIKLQIRYNKLDRAIDYASENSPLNTHFVPEGELKLTQLDQGAGNVVEYKPVPGMTSNPVITATPAFINEQFMHERREIKELMQFVSGISELSSQSTNPLGANASGKALETMENVETVRFNTQKNTVIRAYVDVARMYLDSVDEDKDILPKDKNRAGLKWQEVVQQKDAVKIEFTATASLSNDPEKRLEMITKMVEMKAIPDYKVGEYMDMPDIESAFNEVSAVNDSVERIINDALTLPEKELKKIQIPIFVDYATLEKEIIALQNQFYGQGGDKTDEIGRLQLLYNKNKEVMMQTEKPAHTGEAPAGEEGAPEPSEEGPDNVAFAPLTSAGGIETDPHATQGGIQVQNGALPVQAPVSAESGVADVGGITPHVRATPAGRIG